MNGGCEWEGNPEQQRSMEIMAPETELTLRWAEVGQGRAWAAHT